MTPGLVVDRLHELADRARRLPPPHPGRPDAFHEARDELARDLAAAARLVAELLETDKQEVHFNENVNPIRAAGRRGISRTIIVAGRRIEVQAPRPAFAL